MLLSTLLNHYLSQDPEIAKRLSAHTGKILHIELLPFKKNFFMTIHDSHISLSSKSEIPAQAVIRGTPLNLLAASLTSYHTVSDDVHLSGDILFIQELKNIFQAVDIDWGEVLSKITGDPLAYAASQLFSRLNIWRSRTVDSLSHNLREYLQEECRLLVSRAELENFYKETDDIFHRLARLETRLEIVTP